MSVVFMQTDDLTNTISSYTVDHIKFIPQRKLTLCDIEGQQCHGPSEGNA